jgi:YidC/Oxa1 family membrane protein insertase
MHRIKHMKVWIALGALLFLSACTNVLDPATGQVMQSKIITLETTIGQVFNSESWFTALFVFPVSQAINFINQYIGVVLSIIVVTIVVKIITLGFTIKSTVAAQKMQMINPELKRIQDKYAGKDDNQSKMKMGQEMNALYAKHNINPFGSILVMFIQLPIIIAFYQAVQRADAVVNGFVMGHSLQITPLAAFTSGIWVFVVIYVLMGVVQFISMKLPQYLQKKNGSQVKEKAYAKDGKKKSGPNMEVMMYTSIGMILFFAVNWPTAMSLYWLVTAVTQALQTLFIQYRYIQPTLGQ